jgi:hypothetical protein
MRGGIKLTERQWWVLQVLSRAGAAGAGTEELTFRIDPSGRVFSGSVTMCCRSLGSQGYAVWCGRTSAGNRWKITPAGRYALRLKNEIEGTRRLRVPERSVAGAAL